MELTHPLVHKLDGHFLRPIDYFPAFKTMDYPIFLDSSAQHEDVCLLYTSDAADE